MAPDVERLLPNPGIVEATRLVETVRHAARGRRPFDAEVITAFGELARRLRRHPDARRFPQIAALAYWIRPAELARMGEDFSAMHRDDLLLVPRGAVFHVPPANVDTLFVYTWVLSAVVGNANVIRLGPDQPPATQVLLDVLGQLFDEGGALCETTAFVRYGHETAVTEALSTADVRMVWGGDETVRQIRQIPRPPRSVEVAFADRYSFSVMDAARVVAFDDKALTSLAASFYNDAYWFDQMGCSSPRLVIWRGDEATATKAADSFYRALSDEVANHDVQVSAGATMAKLVHAGAASIDGIVRKASWRTPGVTVARLSEVALIRDSPGGGLFYDARIDELDELVGMVSERDQTLTHHGLALEELRGLAVALNGAGIDRMVPVGSALTFSRIWDGYDLMRTLTTAVTIETGER